MVHVVWEFQVRPDRQPDFERYYTPNGRWADLFRRSPAYKETILAKDIEVTGRYLLTDVWQDDSTYLAFKQQYQDEYFALDKACEPFLTEEKRLGTFEVQR